MARDQPDLVEDLLDFLAVYLLIGVDPGIYVVGHRQLGSIDPFD
jgi:hypothetical protein